MTYFTFSNEYVLRRQSRMFEARKKGRHTKEQWKSLVNEFDGRCLICGSTPRFITKDHIIPVCMGGSDGIENLQPLCQSCNSRMKYNGIDFRPARRQFGFEMCFEVILANSPNLFCNRGSTESVTPGIPDEVTESVTEKSVDNQRIDRSVTDESTDM